MGSMAEVRVGVKVADDRKSVTVEIGPVGGASYPVGLELEQLTKVIGLLGQARRAMIAGHPVEPLEGRPVEVVVKPPWHVQVAHIDGSLLAFDHPAFGAVAFAIPRDHVAEIVRVLNEHLALPQGLSENPS